MDYKQTLNLPHTEFAMKAELAKREPEFLAQWQAMDLYQQLRDKHKDSPKFLLHDGPPYANGAIHIGHAVNKILKDIIIKAKTLSGYDTPYVPGWDCHGLPIELNVEKKLGKVGVKVDAKTFRRACRDYAESQIKLQKQGFVRLGVFADWQNPYKTMDFNFEANIIRSVGKIIEKGHLTHGFKPVYWCMDCGSALAEAEVEYQDKQSQAIDVGFTVADLKILQEKTQAKNFSLDLPCIIPIWTTTPWTLPANQAVAIHPEENYVLVECELSWGKVNLIVAHALYHVVMARYACSTHTIKASFSGPDLEGLQLEHPFYEKNVPIVLGEHVTVDTGTGAVHTAPGHGLEDYLVALDYHLPVVNPVGPDGRYLPDTALFAGEHIYHANQTIIELLQNRNRLLHLTQIQHSYPHCWRHKVPVIFRATPQWFISMDKMGLREQAINAIFKTHWIPDWGRERLAGLIADRPDWCVSRQRFWGVPLPIFYHKTTYAFHPKTQAWIEFVAQRVEKQGIDAWYDIDPKVLLGDEIDDYEAARDTLDVWFESGVTHACVLKQNPALKWPADLYLEGSDQHRGWFQSSLLTGIAMYDHAPYKAVLTHGYTVDAQGRKMSKSLGNVVAPEEVINTLGADILRLWVASTDYRAEISVSQEILNRMTDAYRRIRNTARFLLSNLHDFDPEQHMLAGEEMLALDRWAVDKTRILQEEIISAYDNYQFHVIYQKIHQFCSMDLGSFYLDVIKDRQYTLPVHSLARRSAQTAMYYIIHALVRWLAPILSFTAEDIWQHIPGKNESSVFLTSWYEHLFSLSPQEMFSQLFWQKVLQLRDAVNKELENKRNQNEIGSGLAADVKLYCDAEWQKLLSLLQNELRFVLITSSSEILALEDKPEHIPVSEIDGVAIEVLASPHQKCVRCWHRRPDVGAQADHVELCERCVENVIGSGEKRFYA